MRVSDWSSDVCSSDLSITALEAALDRARVVERSTVIVIDTDPGVSTDAGGAWWDVAVPQTSDRTAVSAARADYETQVRRARSKRSEEHTSELQSLMRISYAVFCLKKKNTRNTTKRHNL